MVSLIYTLCFVITVLMLAFLVVRYKNRISIYYFLLFASATVCNFGYMQLVSAQNIESAVYANQITYLGGCFCPFFMMMCIADLCKTKVNKILQTTFIAYSVIVFIFVSTIGTPFSLYYKSVQFIRENGFSYLIKEYGPFHVLYPIYIISVGVVGIAFIINAFRCKKDVSYIISSWLLVVLSVTDAVYLIEKGFKLKVELLPFSLMLSLAGTLLLLRRISMYEITVISANSMVESLAYGFVICDSTGKFLGADEAAKIWFPEVKELAIDRTIDSENTEFLKQICKWLRNEDTRSVVYIEKDDKIIEAKHSIIKECKHHDVHCIYLRDETKQQQYTRLVSKYNEDLEKEVEKKTENLQKIQRDILLSMASIVENRDSNTGGHVARTSSVVTIFVDYLQSYRNFEELTPHMAKSIAKAAPLHDFGKIAIPDSILNKDGKFEPYEYEIMKQHAEKGVAVVERILHHIDDTKFREIAANVAHYHHEKWDGKGYPEGLCGENIPFEARVMALADVFDALVSKRVYKESFSYDKAFGIIEESCGTHFDPELCRAFLECRPSLEALYDSYGDGEK